MTFCQAPGENFQGITLFEPRLFRVTLAYGSCDAWRDYWPLVRGACWIVGGTPHPHNCDRYVNSSRSLIVCRSCKFRTLTQCTFTRMSSFHWVVTNPLDPTTRNAPNYHEHPAFRSVSMSAEGYAYFQPPWLQLSTMGSLGHYVVQPRREIPTVVRGGQDAS